MSDFNTEVVDSEISTADTTATNEQSSQPSEVEQLRAELAKAKAIAERKSKQLDAIKATTQEAETPQQKVVPPTTTTNQNGDERIEAIEFKMAHPELDSEDVQSVLKIARINGTSLENALQDPLIKNNIEYKRSLNTNSQATLSGSRTSSISVNNTDDAFAKINALPEKEREAAIREARRNVRR